MNGVLVNDMSVGDRLNVGIVGTERLTRDPDQESTPANIDALLGLVHRSVKINDAIENFVADARHGQPVER